MKKTPDRKTQVPQPRGGGTCVLCLLFCIGRAEENCQPAHAFSKAVSVRAEASNDCSWRATTMKTRRSSSANARGGLPSWKRAITWTLKPISRSSITAKRCTKSRNTYRNIVNITSQGREPRRCYVMGVFLCGPGLMRRDNSHESPTDFTPPPAIRPGSPPQRCSAQYR